MIRSLCIDIKDCFDCPYLTTNEGYADYQYVCEKFNLYSPFFNGSPEDEEKIYVTLSDWFSNSCHLDRIEFL